MYPRNFFKLVHAFQKLGGTYNLEQSAPSEKPYLLAHRILLILVCQVYLLPSEWVVLPRLYEDMGVLLEHLGFVIVRDLGFFKFTVLLYNGGKVAGIFKRLDDERFRYEDCDEYKPGEQVEWTKKVVDLSCWVFLGLGSCVPLIRLGSSLRMFQEYGHLLRSGNMSCQAFLPCYNYIPFPMDTPGRCKIAVVFQSLTTLVPVFEIIGVDLTIIGILHYTRTHFINLQGAFRTMRKRCYTRLDLPNNYSILHDNHSPRVKRELQEEVEKMSNHLQVTISLVKDIEEIFSSVFLGQMLGTLFVLVTCLYKISEVSVRSPEFVSQMVYISSMFVEFTPFCMLGNEVTHQSSELIRAIWESEWLSCTPQVKKSLLLHMTRLRRPIYLTIGKFSPLSLATFVSVIKGSYSYYTFLSTQK